MDNDTNIYQDIYERARPLLEKRLNEFRFLHSISVSDTAAAMAKKYDVDPDAAALAGLLHDWDKNFSDAQLFKRLEEFAIELPWPLDDMGSILHALTGAQAVKRQFPKIDPAIVQAISRHTTGAVDMSELDIIIYVADMIEPLRSYGKLAHLRAAVGKVSLDTLFLESFSVTLTHLIRRHRSIHPASLEVWNFYVSKMRGSDKELLRSEATFKSKRAAGFSNNNK